MKKIRLMILLSGLIFLGLVACDNSSSMEGTTLPSGTTPTTSVTTLSPEEEEKAIYQLLVDAENLSGMSKWNNIKITSNIDLELPMAYRGVTITYSSRNPEIISDLGIVTQPDECWIESRKQDGVTPVPHLNDDWPVVLDVLMTYQGQERTAKLMFVVAPAEGFTCDKYKG
jgi:hypothetical protein